MQRWSWIAAGATIGCALTLGAQFTLQKLSETNLPNQAPKRTTIATIGVQGDPSMGSRTAPVTIVEFSDFECPYCKRFHDETFPLLKKNYIDKGLVKFIHKDLPLPFTKMRTWPQQQHAAPKKMGNIGRLTQQCSANRTAYLAEAL